MADQTHVEWPCIASGKPTQNAAIDIFMWSPERGAFEQDAFTSLAQVRVALGCWRSDQAGRQIRMETTSEFGFPSALGSALRYLKGSG